jgi:hypothetical protein
LWYPAPPILIAISDTPANERGPRHTKPILAAIHKAASRKSAVSFLFARHGDSVGLFVRFPPALISLIKGQLHAKYPDCQIEQLPVDTLDAPPGHESWTMELRLRPDLFPIIRYQQYEDAVQAEIDDPVGGVLQSLAPDGTPVRAMIEIAIRPASHHRVHAAHRAVERLTTRTLFREHRRIAHWYATSVGSSSLRRRLLASAFAFLFARDRAERASKDELEKSSSRLHESEKDLLAAGVKLGQHLFGSSRPDGNGHPLPGQRRPSLS